MGKLKVYKASAGAGKTYSLVYEYIKYLFITALSFDNEGRPVSNKKQKKNVHRGVLAVTFTNKSTAEMKERIVLALDKLARGDEKQYRQNLERDVWKIAAESNTNRDSVDTAVKDVAKGLLIDILQDYSSFRVSTIDGFFQQVVRAFARELNLDNQYQVELDNETIMEMAVDNMLASLGEDSKKELLANLTEFATEKVADSKSWNPRQDIIDLSGLVTSEEYMQLKESLQLDAQKLKAYRTYIKKIIEKFDNKAKDICDRAQELMKSVSNRDEVFAKTTINGFNYEYLRNNKKYEITKSFLKLEESDDVSIWTKGKYKEDQSLSGVTSKLYPLAAELIMMCNENSAEFKDYQTAQIIYAHIYILGILNEINDNAMEICRAKDCMIISSTTEFLHKIIDNSDTPFIYEKVGVATNHFMIDEFQDTSMLQWENFIPLLKESVDNGHESMLVGDVKQSIYRWRNGDWKILHKKVAEEFDKYVEEVNLEYNYRSAKEIIEFNNRLYGSKDESYKSLPELIDDSIKANTCDSPITFTNVYAKAEQKVNPNNKKGYVNCRFFEDDEDKTKTWEDKSLDAMVEQIGRIGTYRGVAVLVRTNNEAQIVADRFKVEKIPFYSSEALCVADNAAVRFIIAVMRYINQPYEAVYRANVLSLYNQVCKNRKVSAEDHNNLSDKKDLSDWEKRVFIGEGDITEEEKQFIEEFERMKSYPLMRMIQTLDKLFKLSEIDDCYNKIYIQSFIDKVHEYSINNSVDVRSFLTYWEENGDKTFISMPEGEDAVRIITIFKSKGLEFGVVFLPFVDWSMGVSRFFNIKLVKKNREEDGEVFDDSVPIVPINTRSSKKLLNSRFDEEIISEYADSCLDKLNLFYVATTRAELQLYVYLKKEKDKDDKKEKDKIESISLSTLVHEVLSNDKSMVVNADQTEFEYGGKDGYFEKPIIEKEVSLDDGIETKELIVNYENKATEAEIDARTQLNYKYNDVSDTEDFSARKEGVMMHKLFERIVRIDDVNKAVKSLVRDGDIKDTEVAEMEEKVERILSLDGVRDWYQDRWHVLNEIELFVNEGEEIYRPDRVIIDEGKKEAIIIDYKFGEKNTNLHKRYTGQVRRYMKSIEDMGYDVKGYLLYATEEIVNQITY